MNCELTVPLHSHSHSHCIPIEFFITLIIMSNQIGAGACRICGAEGTNKSTCPRNPNAVKPNPAKHNVGSPKAKVASPSPSPKSPKRSRALEVADFVDYLGDSYGFKFLGKSIIPGAGKSNTCYEMGTQTSYELVFKRFFMTVSIIRYSTRIMIIVESNKGGELPSDQQRDDDEPDITEILVIPHLKTCAIRFSELPMIYRDITNETPLLLWVPDILNKIRQENKL